MLSTAKFRRVATATALSALVGGGALLTAGAAAAADAPEYPWCTPGDLDVSVAEGHAPDDGRLFAITFAAKPVVSCEVEGAPSSLIFFDGEAQQPVEVISPEPGSAQRYTIDEQHPGVAYVSAPAESSDPTPVTTAQFNLPQGGGINVDWPSAIDGPLHLGNIGPAVS